MPEAAQQSPEEKRASASTATVVWLSLVGLTLLGWLLSNKGDAANDDAFVVLFGIVFIAFLKISCILSFFMGLDKAPLGWRVTGGVWVLLTGFAIVVIAMAADMRAVQ